MSVDNLDGIVILKVAEIVGMDPSDIHMDSSFRDLGVDSLDTVELVMELEDLTGLKISEEETLSMHSIGDVCDYLAEHMQQMTPQAEKLLAREDEIREECENREPSPRAVVPFRLRLSRTFSRIGFAIAAFVRGLHWLSPFSLVVVLGVYYLAIFAHWELFLNWLTSRGILVLPPLSLYVVVFGTSTLVPMGLKVLWVKFRLVSWTSILVFSAIVILSFLVVGILGFSGLRQLWMSILHSSYLKQYHCFWLAVSCVLFYVLLFDLIRQSSRIYRFLDEFKAFPLISPVFCFGAPVFWQKSLAALGLTPGAARSLGVVSFVSGIAFLIALVLFYVAKSMKRHNDDQSVDRLLIPRDLRSEEREDKTLLILSLLLVMLGLAGLTYVVFEIGYLALVS